MALLSCAHFALSYAGNHGQYLDLVAFAHGHERTPYQYRVLTAWAMRPLAEAPDAARLAAMTPLKSPYVLAETLLAFVALLGAVLATRRSLEALLGDPLFAAWASLLVVLMAHFQFGLPYGLTYALPYDLPSLLFFCLAMLGIVTRNRPVFYVAFALGTLTRETMLLMAVPFAVWELLDVRGVRREEGWRSLLPHLVAQVAIWGGLKYLVSQSLAGRPPNSQDSGLLEIHLVGNLVSILKPYQWPLMLSLFGFALPFLFANRQRIRDARLRTTLAVLLPLWGVAMLAVGVVVEIRVFGEMISVVALGVAAIVHQWLQEQGKGSTPTG